MPSPLSALGFHLACAFILAPLALPACLLWLDCARVFIPLLWKGLQFQQLHIPFTNSIEHGFGKITRASCMELEYLRGLQNITLSLLFWWLHRYFHRTDIGEWHPETGQAQGKGKCDSLQPDSAIIGGKPEDLFLQWSPFCHFFFSWLFFTSQLLSAFLSKHKRGALRSKENWGTTQSEKIQSFRLRSPPLSSHFFLHYYLAEDLALDTKTAISCFLDFYCHFCLEEGK